MVNSWIVGGLDGLDAGGVGDSVVRSGLHFTVKSWRFLGFLIFFKLKIVFWAIFC